MRTTALFVVLLILLISCSSASQQARGRMQVKTTVRVENQNILDMTVYILRGSQRLRLGMVTGLTTREFVIPKNLILGATSLRFLADPIGSRHMPVSQEILMSPGDKIEIVIPH